MSKLIVYDEGKVSQECELDRERFTIGRLPHNDLQLDYPAVSGEHAVVTTVRNDSFLEDLNSTNGTRVNGKPVKKCLLQDGDEIRIAGRVLKFVFEPDAVERVPDLTDSDDLAEQIRLVQQRLAMGQDAVLSATLAMPTRSAGLVATPAGGSVQLAECRVLSGPSAGKEIDLAKPVVALGKPGIQVAVIVRGPEGFSIVRREGEPPLLNGVPLAEGSTALEDRDIIDVADTKLEFCLK